MEEKWSTISFSSHPLSSCFIALYTLILIFFPYDSLRILVSPVLLISAALLISLLRLGSTRPGKSKEGETKSVNLEETEESKRDTKPDFVEWNLRAPLEVIHEAYEEEDVDDEEEEEENPSVSGEKDPTRFREMERYPSLSLCYPESDSDSDSDSSSEFNFPEMGSWISPEKMGFRWGEEDDGAGGGEGLIEIKLDDEYNKMTQCNQTELDFHAEEQGLIEINLFP